MIQESSSDQAAKAVKEGKTCTNCTHYVSGYSGYSSKCCHPNEGRVNPVNGYVSFPDPSTARRFMSECGPAGRLFEPKPPKEPGLIARALKRVGQFLGGYSS